MKKLLFTFSFMLLGIIAAQAQFFGAMRLEGGFNKHYDKANDESTINSSFGIKPMLGYCLTDKFSLGLIVGYNYSKNEVNGLDVKTTKTNSFYVGPWFYYYILEGKNVKAFVETDVYMQYDNNKYSDDTPKNTANTYGVSVTPGIWFMPFDKFSFNVYLNYFSLNYKYSNINSGDYSHNFGAGFTTLGPSIVTMSICYIF